MHLASLFVEVLYTWLLIFAVRLLVKEHRARLSEVWYCHKLLYALNLVQSMAMLYFYSNDVSCDIVHNVDEETVLFRLVSNGAEFAACTALVLQPEAKPQTKSQR